MRDLKRNLQTLYYALYQSNTNATDTSGNLTGERKKVYGDPVQMKANISPARGVADVEIFGKDLDYTRSVLTHDMTCPITETSILWIDKEPTDGNGNAVPHNYVVTQIAKGLNNIVYAVRKVEVS